MPGQEFVEAGGWVIVDPAQHVGFVRQVYDDLVRLKEAEPCEDAPKTAFTASRHSDRQFGSAPKASASAE